MTGSWLILWGWRWGLPGLRGGWTVTAAWKVSLSKGEQVGSPRLPLRCILVRLRKKSRQHLGSGSESHLEDSCRVVNGHPLPACCRPPGRSCMLSIQPGQAAPLAQRAAHLASSPTFFQPLLRHSSGQRAERKPMGRTMGTKSGMRPCRPLARNRTVALNEK